MNFPRLFSIKKSFKNPNISLKEIKTLWFESKEIIQNLSNPSQLELEVSVDIFNRGIERVGSFCYSWQKGEIEPTDEELDILDEAFNEASWAFNFLATNPPYVCSTENNEGWQKQIRANKQVISKEKNRRKQIKDLQTQINSLQNQPNSRINNTVEIDSLKKKIKELEKQKPNLPFIPNSNVPQQSDSNSRKDGNIHPMVFFCLGFWVCAILVLIIYSVKSQKSNFKL